MFILGTVILLELQSKIVYCGIFKIIDKLGPGKMAQWLFAHTAYVEDWSWALSTYIRWFKTTFNSSSSLLYSESTYTHMSILYPTRDI